MTLTPVPRTHKWDETTFWEQVRKYLLEDPKLVALKTGIKEIARLHTLPEPTAPLPLQTIIDEYINGKVFKYQRQYDDAKVIWDEFAKAVGVDTVDDIQPANLTNYNKVLRSYKPRTQKNRRDTVSAILNYAALLHRPHRDTIAALKVDIKGVVKTAKKSAPQPKPWKPAEYHAMLDACKDDPMWHAILLVSINLGLHGTEMCDLRKEEFDLDNNAFRSTRTKTGVARVAYLWDRTVTAIRKWIATPEYAAIETPLLFYNGTGALNIRKVNAKIRTIRNAAKVNVVFDGIRDLTRTSAGAENLVAIKWIMGHTLPGEDDTYAFRDAKETKSVLQKVERAVFSKGK